MEAIGATRETARPKIVAAEENLRRQEKAAKYRAICMVLDVGPRNSGAAVPVAQ